MPDTWYPESFEVSISRDKHTITRADKLEWDRDLLPLYKHICEELEGAFVPIPAEELTEEQIDDILNYIVDAAEFHKNVSVDGALVISARVALECWCETHFQEIPVDLE